MQVGVQVGVRVCVRVCVGVWVRVWVRVGASGCASVCGCVNFHKKNFALKFVTAKMAKTNLPKTSPGEILKVKKL